MKLSIKLSVFFAAVLWCIPSNANIYGYTRLFHPVQGTTVDLLYDQHVPNNLSFNQVTLYPLCVIKENLFPTEKRFIEALQTIDASENAKDTKLIWELGPSHYGTTFLLPPGPVLLGFGAVIESYLSGIEFIRGDIQRINLFFKIWDLQDDSPLNLSPLTLPSKKERDLIERLYGSKAAQDLVNLYEQKNSGFEKLNFEQLQNCFSHSKPAAIITSGEITDLEMVSHVLCSTKKRILIYCGGQHARGLSRLLTDFFGYEILSQDVPEVPSSFFTKQSAELEVDKLNFLDA